MSAASSRNKVFGHHGPAYCKHCGIIVHDFSAPDDIWEIVDRYIKYGHVLCYDCFCEFCWKLGLPRVWQLEELSDK